MQEFKTIREALAVPSRWVQGVYATRENGSWTTGDDPTATCFCVLGAAAKVYPDPTLRDRAVRKMLQQLPERQLNAVPSDLSKWNDAKGRTHADVLALLARAGV